MKYFYSKSVWSGHGHCGTTTGKDVAYWSCDCGSGISVGPSEDGSRLPVSQVDIRCGPHHPQSTVSQMQFAGCKSEQWQKSETSFTACMFGERRPFRKLKLFSCVNLLRTIDPECIVRYCCSCRSVAHALNNQLSKYLQVLISRLCLYLPRLCGPTLGRVHEWKSVP